jgi:hypothetical protein
MIYVQDPHKQHVQPGTNVKKASALPCNTQESYQQSVVSDSSGRCSSTRRKRQSPFLSKSEDNKGIIAQVQHHVRLANQYKSDILLLLLLLLTPTDP